jgi:hypothetical protein
MIIIKTKWITKLWKEGLPNEGYSRNALLRTKFDIYVFILIQVELIYVNDEVNV